MPYVVSEDLADAGEAKIHQETCGHYSGRDPDAPTMEWHGPFASYEEAVSTARRIAETKRHDYRDAGCCMRGVGLQSVRERPADSLTSAKQLNAASPEIVEGRVTWAVRGQPVPWAGGEPEQRWRAALRGNTPAPSTEVLQSLGGSRTLTLMFNVRPDQVLGMPDLDNLMVPAAEEIRNAGWFSRGFRQLDRLELRKAHSGDELGVVIAIRAGACKDHEPLTISIAGRVREGDRDSSEAIEMAVRHYLAKNGLSPLPLDRAVELSILYRQRRPTSIVSMLKTTVDGLEPLLQRSPTAIPRHHFYPADERVVRILAVRERASEDRVMLGWSIQEDE